MFFFQWIEPFLTTVTAKVNSVHKSYLLAFSLNACILNLPVMLNVVLRTKSQRRLSTQRNKLFHETRIESWEDFLNDGEKTQKFSNLNSQKLMPLKYRVLAVLINTVGLCVDHLDFQITENLCGYVGYNKQ